MLHKIYTYYSFLSVGFKIQNSLYASNLFTFISTETLICHKIDSLNFKNLWKWKQRCLKTSLLIWRWIYDKIISSIVKKLNESFHWNSLLYLKSSLDEDFKMWNIKFIWNNINEKNRITSQTYARKYSLWQIRLIMFISSITSEKWNLPKQHFRCNK